MEVIPNELLEKVTKLENIYFNNNLLTQISDNLFKNNLLLIDMSFRSNKIKIIPEGFFDKFKQLKLIDFSFTQIQKIPDLNVDVLKTLRNLNLLNGQNFDRINAKTPFEPKFINYVGRKSILVVYLDELFTKCETLLTKREDFRKKYNCLMKRKSKLSGEKKLKKKLSVSSQNKIECNAYFQLYLDVYNLHHFLENPNEIFTKRIEIEKKRKTSLLRACIQKRQIK